MSLLKTIIFSLVLILIFSCQESGTDNNNEKTTSGNISEAIKEIESMNDLFNEKKIELKIDIDKNIISNIIYYTMDKNQQIYLLDDNSIIYKFDQNGNFIYSFSKIGRGPGEYLSASILLVDDELNIFIYDRQQYQINKYDANLKFIRSFVTETNAIDMKIMGDKLYTFYPFAQDNSIYIYDLNSGELIEKKGKIDELKKKYSTRVVSGAIDFLGGNLIYLLPNYYQIFVADENGTEIIKKPAEHFKQVDAPIKNPFKDFKNHSSMIKMYPWENHFLMITMPPKGTFQRPENFGFITDILNSKGEVIREALFFNGIKKEPVKLSNSNLMSYSYKETDDGSGIIPIVHIFSRK